MSEDCQVIKKVEFKLKFGPKQIARLREYLDAQRWVWNRGLAIIEWREWFDKWEQVLDSPKHPDYSPEPVPLKWGFNEIKVGKKKVEKVYGLCCDRVKAEKSDRDLLPGEWREDDWILKPHKPEPVKEHWVNEPVLNKFGKDPYFSLVGAFAKKRFDEDHFVQDIPSAWMKGTCKRLADAWKSYKSGVRKRPRYKKRHQQARTLMHPNSGDIKITGDRLTLPGFGKISVKGLAKRWGDRSACPISITLIGNKVFMQLTGKFPAKPKLKMTGRVVGIDPGVARFYTDDAGHYVPSPKILERMEARLVKLEKALSRSLRANSKQIFDEKGICVRTEFNPDWDRKNFNKIKAQLAELYNKIARGRRSFAHYQSTKLVNFADKIVLGDFHIPEMIRSVEKGEPGKPNGRKRKARLTRKLLDHTIGQFYQVVESKGEVAGRVVERVPSYFTSQECNVCGHVSTENRKTQPKFKCLNCGHEDNADRNAARNYKTRFEQGLLK